jgi:hypothetical protein
LCPRARKSTSNILRVAGAPLRFSEGSADRFEDVDSRLQELEQKLLDASSRRIHDFERRLEHEWLALRQLHEEPLKTLEQKSAIAEDSLAVVREALALARTQLERQSAVNASDDARQVTEFVPTGAPRAWVIALVGVLAAIAVFTGYTRWSLTRELRDVSARATIAERRVSEQQQILDRQTRSMEETVQRLTSEALTSSIRVQRLAAILAAPDVRAYPLRGLRTAAAASGQALFSPSRGVAVSISRLPPMPSGQTYQVWLVTSGASISLGFAAADGQGRVDGTFHVPSESAANVTGFMLSQEPTGGSTKPTGPIVIAS